MAGTGSRGSGWQGGLEIIATRLGRRASVGSAGSVTRVTPVASPASRPATSTVTDESQHRSELDEVYELSVVRIRSGPELADGEE